MSLLDNQESSFVKSIYRDTLHSSLGDGSLCDV